MATRADQDGLVLLHNPSNLVIRKDGTTLYTSTPGTSGGYSAGSTTGVFHSDDKYTGGVGSTGYTVNGIVAALKGAGILGQ